VSISVILFNSRFRSYGAQGVLKKHPFCGAFLVFWGFKFLSIKNNHFLFHIVLKTNQKNTIQIYSLRQLMVGAYLWK
ncbi:hypothetical protein U9Y48_25165, partial [Escherichia coli]